MRALLTIAMAVTAFISASAYRYSYSFGNTPISEAIVRISKDHPEVNMNVQGDVVGLLNSSGELVVEYKYDPWGKLLETIIGVDEKIGRAHV